MAFIKNINVNTNNQYNGKIPSWCKILIWFGALFAAACVKLVQMAIEWLPLSFLRVLTYSCILGISVLVSGWVMSNNHRLAYYLPIGGSAVSSICFVLALFCPTVNPNIILLCWAAFLGPVLVKYTHGLWVCLPRTWFFRLSIACLITMYAIAFLTEKLADSLQAYWILIIIFSIATLVISFVYIPGFQQVEKAETVPLFPFRRTRESIILSFVLISIEFLAWIIYGDIFYTVSVEIPALLSLFSQIMIPIGCVIAGWLLDRFKPLQMLSAFTILLLLGELAALMPSDMLFSMFISRMMMLGWMGFFIFVLMIPFLAWPQANSYFLSCLGIAVNCFLAAGLELHVLFFQPGWMATQLGRSFITLSLAMTFLLLILILNVMAKQKESAYVRTRQQNSHRRTLAECNLSPREMVLAQLLLLGYSRKEICEKMYISRGTVNTLCTRMYKKTECKNQTELIAIFGTHETSV